MLFMLPSPHQNVYLTWLKALKSLQEAVIESGDGRRAAWGEVEHLFQNQVMGLTEAGIDPETISRWRSIQTELHRMFRLLATDWLFLQSSRQQATRQQRLARFSDRLEQIIQFCNMMLEGTEVEEFRSSS
jgi:hypothetical protein